MPKRSGGEGTFLGMGCGCFLLVLLVNLSIGAFAFDYALSSILGKDIPWFGDMICGLFLGELAIPAMVICWVMRLCGIHAPFIS
jgi:hypothetical protein